MKLEKTDKITILALSWRDIKAPKAGGAEIHTHALLSLADQDKFRVISFSMAAEGLPEEEVIDGVTYLRAGGVLGVITAAARFYRQNADNIDFVIDQCNTHRFFTKFWVPEEKRIFYIHQLTREIWNIHMKPPFSWIGAAMETPMLRLSRKDYCITISDSTKADLVAVGFNEDRVMVIPEWITTKPWPRDKFCEKEEPPYFIFVGRFARYKGINTSVEALGEVRKTHPDVRLKVCGKPDMDYVNEQLKPICDKYNMTIGTDENCDVYLAGFVADQEKLTLQSKAVALLFPSIREGWGLIISEAASVGTPSIVYNAPGSVDAVNKGRAGFLSETNDVKGIADKMLVCLENPTEYNKMRDDAYAFTVKYLQWGDGVDFMSKIIDVVKNKKSADTIARDF